MTGRETTGAPGAVAQPLFATTHWSVVLASADLVAGIAELAGYLAFDFNQYAPSEPVNILHINGTADDGCMYWGGAVTMVQGFLTRSFHHRSSTGASPTQNRNGNHDWYADKEISTPDHRGR